MNSFDQADSNQKNKFSNSRQRSPFNEDSSHQSRHNRSDENDFVEPQEDVDEDNYDNNDHDNDSLLSYESANSRQRSPSNHRSRTVLDVPGGSRRRNQDSLDRQQSRSNRSTHSTHSFNSQRSKNRAFNDQDSLASPSLSTNVYPSYILSLNVFH